jgi:hypothetical protein
MHKSPKFVSADFGKLAKLALSPALALAAELWLSNVASAQSPSPAPAPVPEEHWYYNPFYVVTGILVLALIPQILYQRRKRAAERESGNRLRITPAGDVGFGLKAQPTKKKGRLSKEEMSSLLKASNTQEPVFDTDLPPNPEGSPTEETAPPAEPEAEIPAEPVPEVFVAPTATAPIETGTVIRVDALSPAPEMSPIEDYSDDDDFLDALDQLQDPDPVTRVLAVRVLGQFKSRNAVNALNFAVANDRESTVRAAAVASLGMVGHESVFPAVLGSCADTAPDVRLAAARTLSDLKFSRAEAYARLIEEGDPAVLAKAVAACQQTGMTQRAFDRLASPDSRQSYEAFAILSLLVKAGETKPLFNAIAQHPAENIRLAAIKLLRESGIPGIFEKMSLMADQPALTPRVRAALMDHLKPGAKRSQVVDGYSQPAPSSPEPYAPSAQPPTPPSAPPAAPPVADPWGIPAADASAEPLEFTSNDEVISPPAPGSEPKPVPPPVFRDDPLDPFS